MLKIKYKGKDIMFYDIETVREYETLSDAPEGMQGAWKSLSERKWPERDPEESYINESALIPEFSKICCISLGFVNDEIARIKNIIGTEVEIINSFFKILKEWKGPLLGHNSIKFDNTFTIKRAVINRIKIPAIFQIVGAKPWDMDKLMDTCVIWKLTDFNGYASLQTLAAISGAHNPKQTISGKDVGNEFYKGNIDGIAVYCAGDVFSLIQVFQWMVGEEMVKSFEIV